MNIKHARAILKPVQCSSIILQRAAACGGAPETLLPYATVSIISDLTHKLLRRNSIGFQHDAK
jgi:hypothetical protein